jgi:hypothetical protein
MSAGWYDEEAKMWLPFFASDLEEQRPKLELACWEYRDVNGLTIFRHLDAEGNPTNAASLFVGFRGASAWDHRQWAEAVFTLDDAMDPEGIQAVLADATRRAVEDLKKIYLKRVAERN